ncbi:MAG: toll/interleukin-1 receptor domain-containing protein [Chitinophagaceae bacterium]|nr:toll/interleukin-1 receptor domain-containing protein [Chitinophagaceae bacterium]
MKNIKYRGFISFSHKDSQISLDLHKRLEGYIIPKELRGSNLGSDKLGLFFRDREELAANMQLSEQIRDALSRSECLIVVCSLNSVQSEWVEKEIKTYMELKPKYPIYTVIVNGEPPDCIPNPLRNFDSIASDLRSHADGVEDGVLKLISGMLGLRFSDLKDRTANQNKKRQRRLMIWAISFLILSLLSIGGLITTFIYANRAKKLVSASIENYGQIGDKGFTLGLTTGASLDAVEEFLEFSQEKLKELEAFGLEKDELISRSLWIKLRFSHLFLQRKDYKNALVVAEEVIDSTQKRNEYGYMLTYTTAIGAKSQALAGLENKDMALASAKLYLEESVRFNEIYPDRYETRLALSEAHSLFGDMLSKNLEKSAEQAIEQFSISIQLLNDLLKEFPNSATFPMRIAEQYESMGNIALQSDDQNRVANWYSESANWNYRFLQYNKPRLDICQHVLEIAVIASEKYINLNNYKQSAMTMELAVKAMKIAENQFPNDPDIIHNLEKAQTMLSEITKRQNPFNSSFTKDIARIGAVLSRAQQFMDDGDKYSEEGKIDLAVTEFQKAIDLLTPLVKEDIDGKDALEMLGQAKLFAGANAVDAGQFEKAERLLSESIEIWKELITNFPENSDYLLLKSTAEKTLAGLKE